MAKSGKNAVPAGQGSEGQSQVNQAGQSGGPQSESNAQSTGQADAVSTVAGQTTSGAAASGGEAGADKPKHPRQAVAYVIVCAQVDGYRRGGRAWTRKPQAVPVTAFTAEQLAQIEQDGTLMSAIRELTDDQLAQIEAGE